MNLQLILTVLSHQISTTILGAIAGSFTTYLLFNHSKKKEAKSSEIEALEKENTKLHQTIDEYEATEPSSEGNYSILKKTNQAICPVCWGKERKVIPIYDNGTGHYNCGSCKSLNVFSRKAVAIAEAEGSRYAQDLVDALSYQNYNNPY